MCKADKGFGLVGQDSGGKDVFVHATALARAGLSGLVEGQRVRQKGLIGLQQHSRDSQAAKCRLRKTSGRRAGKCLQLASSGRQSI
jgi:cold shock CspA family protein